jgi:hypothetical protein
MDKRIGYNTLNLEDLARLVGTDQTAPPLRAPNQTKEGAAAAVNYFIEDPKKKLPPSKAKALREKIAAGITTPRVDNGYDDTKVLYDIGGNDLPEELSLEDQLAAETTPQVGGVGKAYNKVVGGKPFMGPPSDEDVLTEQLMSEAVGDTTTAEPQTEQSKIQEVLDSMDEESKPWITPEFRKKLDKYSTYFNSASLSPWAALADKWSGGGTELSDVNKKNKDASLLEKERLRQDSIEGRQNKALEAQSSKDFINQVERDIKPLQDVNRAGKAAKLNLVPDANGNVEVAKVENIAALAGKALANIGVQTDKDATRTILPTLTLALNKLAAFITSNPSRPVPFEIVKPLMETLNSVERAYREEVNEKIAVTRDAYVAGRNLDFDKSGRILSPYQSLLQSQAERLEGVEEVIKQNTGKEPVNTSGTSDSKASILDKARARIKSQNSPKTQKGK